MFFLWKKKKINNNSGEFYMTMQKINSDIYVML